MNVDYTLNTLAKLLNTYLKYEYEMKANIFIIFNKVNKKTVNIPKFYFRASVKYFRKGQERLHDEKQP